MATSFTVPDCPYIQTREIGKLLLSEPEAVPGKAYPPGKAVSGWDKSRSENCLDAGPLPR
jgi:hypothetical protein